MAIKQLTIHDKKYAFTIVKNDHECHIVVKFNSEIKRYVIGNVVYNTKTSSLHFEINGKQYKAHVNKEPQNPQESLVTFAHIPQAIRVHENIHSSGPVSDSKTGITPAKRIKENILKSPLAGRVTRILASTGQLIQVGQPLLCIESMKMENEISASRTAYIKTIFIAEGNVVQPNQILIEFEEEGDGDATTQNAHERAAVQDR